MLYFIAKINGYDIPVRNKKTFLKCSSETLTLFIASSITFSSNKCSSI